MDLNVNGLIYRHSYCSLIFNFLSSGYVWMAV